MFRSPARSCRTAGPARLPQIIRRRFRIALADRSVQSGQSERGHHRKDRTGSSGLYQVQFSPVLRRTIPSDANGDRNGAAQARLASTRAPQGWAASHHRLFRASHGDARVRHGARAKPGAAAARARPAQAPASWPGLSFSLWPWLSPVAIPRPGHSAEFPPARAEIRRDH